MYKEPGTGSPFGNYIGLQNNEDRKRWKSAIANIKMIPNGSWHEEEASTKITMVFHLNCKILTLFMINPVDKVSSFAVLKGTGPQHTGFVQSPSLVFIHLFKSQVQVN